MNRNCEKSTGQGEPSDASGQQQDYVPSRMVVWLMGLLAGARLRDVLLGDMEEIRCRDYGEDAAAARRWYWQQFIQSLVPCVCARVAENSAFLGGFALRAGGALCFVMLWDAWAAQQVAWRLSAHVFGAARMPTLGLYLLAYLIGCFFAGGFITMVWRMRQTKARASLVSLKTIIAAGVIVSLPVLPALFSASGDVLVLRVVQFMLGICVLAWAAFATQRYCRAFNNQRRLR